MTVARIPLPLAGLLGFAALAVGVRLALYFAREHGAQRDPPLWVQWWRRRRGRPLYPELPDKKPAGIVYLAPGKKRRSA